MLRYKRVGITVKSGLDDRNEALTRILKILEELGADASYDCKRAEHTDAAKNLPCFGSAKDIDILLVIGGDGTILRAVREMDCFDIPLLSVNRGRVGFLAETNLDEAEELIPQLLKGEGAIDERGLLHVTALREDEVLIDGFALNEAVIAQGTIARLVDLEASINGEPLTNYHADGLIIATPTGSTAYNLAAGGPVVHPTLSATILTPINPHSFTQKPIVIRSDSEIEVEVLTRGSKFGDVNVVLTLDGQVYVSLQRNDKVHAHLHDQTVKFLRRKQDTFFGTLREKLRWGERLEKKT